MRWCERLSLALGLALAVPDSVSMLRLTCPVRVSDDNRRVELPGRQFLAVEWGNKFGQHRQLCFYLASTAPDQPPGSPPPSAPAEDHGLRAVALKAVLGPAANETQSLRDFTALSEPADAEIFIQSARTAGPVAVADVNSALPTFTLFFDKVCDPATPVTMLLRIGQHFQRLYASDLQPVLLSSLLPLHSSHVHTTSTPTASECPVQQVLEWCCALERDAPGPAWLWLWPCPLPWPRCAALELFPR